MMPTSVRFRQYLKSIRYKFGHPRARASIAVSVSMAQSPTEVWAPPSDCDECHVRELGAAPANLQNPEVRARLSAGDDCRVREEHLAARQIELQQKRVSDSRDVRERATDAERAGIRADLSPEARILSTEVVT